MTTWDTTVDLVIVGSGGGGMVAALAAADAGASALVLEKQERIGGSTCMSGGIALGPEQPGHARRTGLPDSYEDAMAHFEAVVGDVGPASSFERRHAFLTAGPEMVSFLQDRGVRFVYCPGYSDYYSSAKGGHDIGRGIEPMPFDGHVLGEWLGEAATRTCPEPRPRGDDERSTLALALQPQHRGVHGLGPRGAADLRRPAPTPGPADERRVADRADPADRHRPWHLGLDGGAARRPDRRGRPRGRRADRSRRRPGAWSAPAKGVVLASGGFAHNPDMRERFGGDQPNRARWSIANPGDTGEVIQIAMRHRRRDRPDGRGLVAAVAPHRAGSGNRRSTRHASDHARSTSMPRVNGSSTSRTRTWKWARRCTPATRRAGQCPAG